MFSLQILLFSAAAIFHVTSVQTPVNLGTAANYVLLAQSGLTTTGATSITGDVGLSPVTAAAMTGFGETLAAGGSYSTSSLVQGKIFNNDYAAPTPATLNRAIADQRVAYNDAVSRTNPDYVEFSINGPITLQPGLYKWVAAMSVGGTITLSGSSSSVYIFQVGGALTFLESTNIILSGGVLPSNVFWQGNGAVVLNIGARVQGNLLGLSSFALNNGATLKGRIMAQSTCTLIANTISPP